MIETESLDVQQEINEQAAPLRGFFIQETFREDCSGRQKSREIFTEVDDYLLKHPEIKAVFIRQIDRFSRAGSDVYLKMKRNLTKRGLELIDTAGIIQPTFNSLHDVGFKYDWSERSPSRIAEIMAAEIAHEEVSTILTRMIGQEIRLAQKGYMVREANFGYKNHRIEDENGKKRTIMLPDDKEASFIEKMFQLRAEGNKSDKEICDELNLLGFRSRKKKRRHPKTGEVVGYIGGKKLLPKQLQKFISNPVYCGVRIEKWTNHKPIKLAFQGLIDIDLFNRANRGKIAVIESENGLQIRHGAKPKRRLKEHPDYPFRFVVKCPICGGNLVGSASTGKRGKKYPAYHCTHKGHYFRVPVSKFHKVVSDYVEKLKFDLSNYTVLIAEVEEILRNKIQEQNQNVETVRNRITQLEQEQSVLYSKLLTTASDVVAKKLEADIDSIQDEIDGLGNNQSITSISTINIKDIQSEVKDFMEHPGKFLLKPHSQAKTEKVWNTYFEALPSYTDLEYGTPKLSHVFRVYSSPLTAKEVLVRQEGLNWNSLIDGLLHLREVKRTLIDDTDSH